MDVADLVDLEVVALVVVVGVVGIAKVVQVDAEVIVQDAVFRAPVIVEVAVDVMGVILDVVGVVGIAKVVQDAQDVEVHVQAHARLMVKVPPVQRAIVVPDVQVHVHHVHHVVDAVDAVDAQVVVADVLDVRPAAKGTVLPNVADAPVDAIPHAVDAQVDAVDAQVDAVDVLDAVRDVTAHALEHVMVVVMNAVDNVKTHVLLPAQQRVLVHVKLKHLEL